MIYFGIFLFQADDSHEISGLIFSEKKKEEKKNKMSSAAVVISMLTLSMLGKYFSRWHFGICFSYFPRI